MTPSRSLLSFRNHCRKEAVNEDHPPSERDLWAQLAVEIDSFINYEPEPTLFNLTQETIA